MSDETEVRHNEAHGKIENLAVDRVHKAILDRLGRDMLIYIATGILDEEHETKEMLEYLRDDLNMLIQDLDKLMADYNKAKQMFDAGEQGLN